LVLIVAFEAIIKNIKNSKKNALLKAFLSSQYQDVKLHRIASILSSRKSKLRLILSSNRKNSWKLFLDFKNVSTQRKILKILLVLSVLFIRFGETPHILN